MPAGASSTTARQSTSGFNSSAAAERYRAPVEKVTIRVPPEWTRVGDGTFAHLAHERQEHDYGIRLSAREQDTEVAGVPVPESAKVPLFLGSADRDPRRWGEYAGPRYASIWTQAPRS